MKIKEMELIAKSLGPHLRAIVKRLDALEARTGLSPEAKSLADNYLGIWRDQQTHQRGNLVTHNSSLWLCLKDTTGKPGSSQAWRLVSKNGRPPRDTE